MLKEMLCNAMTGRLLDSVVDFLNQDVDVGG